MTIATSKNTVTAQGNGVTIAFNYDFLMDTAGHAIVIYTDANGVITTIASGNYTLTGVGNAAGGTYGYQPGGAPMPVGSTLTLYRIVPYTQGSSINNQGNFYPQVVEAALDYLTYQTQQLSQYLSRVPLLPSNLDATLYTMTLPTPLAGAAIGWDGTGKVLSNIVTLGGVGLPLAVLQGGTGQTQKDRAAAALGVVSLTGAGGTANAQTATAPANYTAFTANDVFEYTPPVTNTGAVQLTITPNGGAALASKNVFYDGAACAGSELVLGVPTWLMYDGVQLNIIGYSRKIRSTSLGAGFNLINGTIVQTRAANAETIAVKTLAGADPSAADPVGVVFRDQASTTGGYVTRWLTAALSLTISSGSTMGARNGIPFRLWYTIFDDAGTLRLAAINCITSVAGSGAGSSVTDIYPLGGFAVASSTAEGGAGAADSAQIFYTGVAVSSKPYVPIGYATWEAGLAAVGTWGTAPSRIQLYVPGSPLPGYTIQNAFNGSGAVSTGSTAVPADDTIPQITEGDQYLTKAITPSSAANVLRLGAHIASSGCSSSGENQTASIFQDATVNALVSCLGQGPSIAVSQPFIIGPLKYQMLAATSVSTTFRLRAGGGTGTFTFNGRGGTRADGGVLATYLEAMEVMG